MGESVLIEEFLADPLVLMGLKVMFLLGLGIYIFFSVIVMRQVQLMVKTIQGGLDTVIKLGAVIHFLVAVGVFLLGVVVL